jgi:hypothetical protein
VSTSEEMDVISMSFILPSAECDLNLNTHTKGWLNCIIFIGKEHVLCQHEVLHHFSETESTTLLKRLLKGCYVSFPICASV